MSSVLALGALAFVWPAAHAVHQQRALLAAAPRAVRPGRIVMIHAAVWLGLFALAVLIGGALVSVPSGLIGNLGFFPLLRGLGGVTSVSFVAPAPGPPLLTPLGTLPTAEIARAAAQGGIDGLALFIPVLALATGAELITLGLLFAVVLVIAAGLSARQGPAAAAPGPSRSQRLRPWTQLALGLGVLVASGSFNWLLHPRG